MRRGSPSTSTVVEASVLFNSYIFVFVFLPLVVLGWWALPTKNLRLTFLTLTSYVFYGWWDYRFVPLMLLSSTADFFAARAIHRCEDPRRRKLILVALLVFNLGILGVFKYYDFFIDSCNGLARLFGADPMLPRLNLILPVGISFYTFNSISYTIDVYRRRIAPARNVLEFSSFVAMFPHLVAGPIVRYSDMDDQFANLPSRPSSGQFVVGIWFFVIGMTKKVLLADLVAQWFVVPLLGGGYASSFETAWIGAIAYTLQIYFDFSGYSDMAVGLAFLLGLRFPQNFDSPYKAENIAAFWRRWHMSLSFWLRDYLFISIGGSRGTRLRTARNLALTMFLGGLWHGASWTFVVWGIYHGALLAGYQVLKERDWVPRSTSFSIGLTFLAVMLGWVVFHAPTIGDAGTTLAHMFGLYGPPSLSALVELVARPQFGVIIVGLAIVWFAPNTWQLRYSRGPIAAIVLAGLLLLCTLRFAAPSPFLYLQF